MESFSRLESNSTNSILFYSLQIGLLSIHECSKIRRFWPFWLANEILFSIKNCQVAHKNLNNSIHTIKLMNVKTFITDSPNQSLFNEASINKF